MSFILKSEGNDYIFSDASLFNPYSNGHITFDSSFSIDTYKDLNRMKVLRSFIFDTLFLKNLSTYLLAKSKLRPDTALWLDLFKQWMNSTSCTPECCFSTEGEGRIHKERIRRKIFRCTTQFNLFPSIFSKISRLYFPFGLDHFSY